MNNEVSKIKVSVIIPTYNRAQFLPGAVKSIIDQNYKNIEIIIVDDGSDDETQDVVKTLKDEHPIIVYCHNNRLKGPSGARNTGILKASGDYLSFLDSDDVWVKGQLKNGLKFLERNPEIDVLFGNAKIVDIRNGEQCNFLDKHNILHSMESEEVIPGIRILRGNMFEALIQANFFLFGSAIIRRSVLKDILLDEFIMYSEDRDFAIRLYKEAKASFAFRKEPVVIQHRHDSNICNNTDTGHMHQLIKRKRAESHLYLFTKYLKNYDLSFREKRLIKKIIANRLSNVSYNYWINKEYRNYLSYMMKSFKYNLTLTQLRNLLKVLIYPFIRHRYHKFITEPVPHSKNEL